MTGKSGSSAGGRILVVEDDPGGLRFFQSSLTVSGYEVLPAASANEAQQMGDQWGWDSIDAVLTDFRMPGRTGLDLLQWLQKVDPTLATVIVTAQGEKDLVKQTLNSGGAGFMDKPVVHQVVVETMAKAVAKTRLQRENETNRRGLKEASDVAHDLNERIPESLKGRMRVAYHPLHQFGGDFFNAWHTENPAETMILLGDVSGHDIRAGYTAAFFQGIFRGNVSSGEPVDKCLQKFNKQLIADAEPVPTSLAVCWLIIDEARGELTSYNCGFPPFTLIGRNGSLRKGKLGTHPLGWVDKLDLVPEKFNLDETTGLIVFTDGIIEQSVELGVDPLSLVYTIFGSNLPDALKFTALLDDILVLKYISGNNTTMTQSFEPIINEQYSGAEYIHIDSLQSVWRRSLEYALGEEIGDRLYDLLICIREGMLNALIHGCSGSSEKFCHLQISINAKAKHIKVRIDDPGKGHDFDIRTRRSHLEDLPQGRQLGLGIVQHLSDAFQIENKGTSLVFDFFIQPEGARKSR